MSPGDIERLLSEERVRRLRGLSDVRALYNLSADNLRTVAAQSLIVLCYANWEGYFNYCVDAYIKCVNELDARLIEVNPALLACSIERYIMSMRDRNFPIASRPLLARNIFSHVDDREISENQSMLKSSSNLDYKRLKTAFDALDLEISRFEEFRNFIQHELVGWRHQVAHGSEPDLERADLLSHSGKTEQVLLIMKEAFEDRLRSLCAIHG